MKFDLCTDTPKLTRIVAHPTDFDAHPPVKELRIKWQYAGTSTDRFAVAASLAFSPWSAGAMMFPSEISALTAQRIGDWFRFVERVWVGPNPVRWGGLKIPKGRDVLSIGGIEAEGTLVLEYRGMSEASSLSDSRVQVASNAAYLVARDDGRSQLLTQLAVAVLLAEEIGVNEIRLPSDAVLSTEDFAATTWLLECVGLGLAHG